MKVEVRRLLDELRTVQAGLSLKETVEQSTCFVFRKGHVYTYNDDVACRGPCCLNITGAVNARKMVDMLTKWPDEQIEFTRHTGRLQFRGKGKRGYFITQDKITLPIRDVERPSKWHTLPKGFIAGVELVQECACRAAESPHLSCIHFTPNYLEACDGVQAGRVEVALGKTFRKPVLVRAAAMRFVSGCVTPVRKIGETTNWVHFRNKNGLVLSCHKCIESYPTHDLSTIFATRGQSITLPDGLRELVVRSQVFLDDEKTNWLDVKITSTHIQVTGRGEYGTQTERKKIKHSGRGLRPISFCINPRLLRNLTNIHDECEISEKVLHIRRGEFQYITSLRVPDEKEQT
jgi:hypothetical protein